MASRRRFSQDCNESSENLCSAGCLWFVGLLHLLYSPTVAICLLLFWIARMVLRSHTHGTHWIDCENTSIFLSELQRMQIRRSQLCVHAEMIEPAPTP